MPETYLKPVDTAAKINVSIDKLALDRMNGVGLPFVVFGTSIRYPLSAVEQYMAAHLVIPGAPTPPGIKRRKGGPGRPPAAGGRLPRRTKRTRRAA